MNDRLTKSTMGTGSARLRRIGACLVLMLLLGPPLAAGAAEHQPRVPVDQATTRQKAVFLQNLVTKSVAVRTIEESGDQGAMEKLATARDLVRQARADLDAGNHGEANERLDQALALVNAEVRRLSKTEVNEARRREAYEKRLHTVQTFLKAYERVAGEKEVSAAARGQMTEMKRLVAEAEGQAAQGRLEDANATLDRAYRTARGDIRQMREGQTLTRSLDFATAAEEYDYERDRNESHIMLLKFALSEKQPPENFVERIEKLRLEALDLRSAAEGQASSGKHPEAIQTISKSTDTLLKAIRMSGIYIPG